MELKTGPRPGAESHLNNSKPHLNYSDSKPPPSDDYLSVDEEDAEGCGLGVVGLGKELSKI